MRMLQRTGMRRPLAALLLALGLLLSGCGLGQQPQISLGEVPAYSGAPYVELDGNQPAFAEADMEAEAFESYAPLDLLGRCGTAYACLSPELMTVGERGSVGQVKPTGWHTVRYDFVDGQYLYNRCHLIGYQLSGENANERNLITGTRYLNVEGMLPFEEQVADYIRETGGRVLYRVTPIFEGNDLLAAGVEIEALSVGDAGEGVCFHVYCYNVQPGVGIDYATGDSRPAEAAPADEGGAVQYVLNTRSKRFHRPDCASVDDISPSNRQDYTGSREALTARGYKPCGSCAP